MTASCPAERIIIDRPQALRIIEKLRKGTDCLEGVQSFSAGRHPLVAAAVEQFEELELSAGATVRWVRGRTGQGKTHFFARLIDSAHARNWVTSYVQISDKGAGVELHRFEEVYAAIIRNCLCSELVAEESGRIEPGQIAGWDWILQHWWTSLRRQVAARGSGTVPTFRLQETIAQAVTALRRRWNVHAAFAEALRQFALAEMEGDVDWSNVIRRWFQGHDVHSQGGDVRARLRAAGIPESVRRQNAREMLRSVSAFLKYRGHGGVLILLDELENVLHQPPSGRRAAWVILRELIDNLDDVHGMTHAAFYIAATPDVFEAEKGITEYEALAERVLLPGHHGGRNPAASLIDLAAWPLMREDLLLVGERITALHMVAKNWQAGAEVAQNLAELLDECLRRDRSLTARSWVKEAVNRLDQLREAHR